MSALARLRLMVLVALAAWPAAASAAPTTAPAVGEGTVFVTRFDLSKLAPADVERAAKVLFQRQAELAPSLATYADMHKKASAAGITMVQFLVALPGDRIGGPSPTVIDATFAGEPDAEVVRPLIAQVLGPDSAAGLAYDKVGRDLLVHPKADALPTADAAQSKVFADAAGAIGDRSFIQIFVPNLGLRTTFLGDLAKINSPPFATDLARSLLDSRWIAAGVDAGDAPTLTLLIEQPDAAAAEQLQRRIEVAIEQSKKMLASQPAAGKLAWADDVSNLLDKLKPARDGSRVTVALDKKDAALAASVVRASLLRARESAKQAQSISNMRQIAIAIQMYAADHNDNLPDRLDQLFPYLGPARPGVPSPVMRNPITGEWLGYLYVKPAANMREVKNSGTVPVLYEMVDGKRDPNGAIAYADGHVERVKADE